MKVQSFRTWRTQTKLHNAKSEKLYKCPTEAGERGHKDDIPQRRDDQAPILVDRGEGRRAGRGGWG